MGSHTVKEIPVGILVYYKHFKDVKSVEVSDFKLSRSSYFAIMAAYLMRVISLKLRKNQIYK